jgi:hypothetical protein
MECFMIRHEPTLTGALEDYLVIMAETLRRAVVVEQFVSQVDIDDADPQLLVNLPRLAWLYGLRHREHHATMRLLAQTAGVAVPSRVVVVATSDNAQNSDQPVAVAEHHSATTTINHHQERVLHNAATIDPHASENDDAHAAAAAEPCNMTSLQEADLHSAPTLEQDSMAPVELISPADILANHSEDHRSVETDSHLQQNEQNTDVASSDLADQVVLLHDHKIMALQHRMVANDQHIKDDSLHLIYLGICSVADKV